MFGNLLIALREGLEDPDGSDGIGRLDAGLSYLGFVRDPVTQYVAMQTRLARDDAMPEYLRHRGSALFAVRAGASVSPTDYVARAFLGSWQ